METVIKISEGNGELFVNTCNNMNIPCREMAMKARPHRPIEYVVKFNDPIELFYLGLAFQKIIINENG